VLLGCDVPHLFRATFRIHSNIESHQPATKQAFLLAQSPYRLVIFQNLPAALL